LTDFLATDPPSIVLKSDIHPLQERIYDKFGLEEPMPRRKANVNLTDARRFVRACKLEGIDFRATLEPGGAVVFESATTSETPTGENSPLDQWRSGRGQS
jgi:hypothetical protein